MNLLLLADPPEEVTVDQKSLQLIEGEEMEPITCSGSGSPELTFYWTLQEEEEVVGEGEVLTFSQPVERSQAGEYLCHGANRHGEQVADFSLSVLYRPECEWSDPGERLDQYLYYHQVHYLTHLKRIRLCCSVRPLQIQM